MPFNINEVSLIAYDRVGPTYQSFIYANTAGDSSATVSASNYFLPIMQPDIPQTGHGAVIGTGAMIYDQFNGVGYRLVVNSTTEPTTVTVQQLYASSGGGGSATGTYTPTLFNTTNVASSIPFLTQYNVTGNQVEVFGQVSVTVTAGTTNTVLGISLPIPTTAATAQQYAGTAAAVTNGLSGAVTGDTTNFRALVQFNNANTGAQVYKFVFNYAIV